MGPLSGLKLIEIASQGPGPFCGMMLSDMGADIIRVDRKGNAPLIDGADIMNRGRHTISVDLKDPDGIELVLSLVENADGLFEGFRPGVMERLGLGPEQCFDRNQRLVYGRITGWGQEGPLCRAAGHDINYISLSGALHAIGEKDGKPVPPLNLLGDYGGGGMLIAFGMVCALYEARISGKGQVVDAAMVDGSCLLMTLMYGLKAAGEWKDRRGVNFLDGGAHFYDTYETADDKWIAIGAIEPQFYDLMLRLAQIEDPEFQAQMDPDKWPVLKERMATISKTKTRDEWCAIMEGTDVCFAPVLSMEEAPKHAHSMARNAFINIDGKTQPAPAPRFSRTQPERPKLSERLLEQDERFLADWGFSTIHVGRLKNSGVIS